MMQLDKEYAVALFELSLEEGEQERIREELAAVMQAVEENPLFLPMLSTPAIPMSERLCVIDDAFAGRLSEHTVSFLKILCEEGRVDILPDAVSEYDELVRRYAGRLKVRVVSAAPLSEEQKERLEEKLCSAHKRDIEATYSVDPSIIGGLVVETEDKIYDGSLKGRLRSVKDVMNG